MVGGIRETTRTDTTLATVSGCEYEEAEKNRDSSGILIANIFEDWSNFPNSYISSLNKI